MLITQVILGVTFNLKNSFYNGILMYPRHVYSKGWPAGLHSFFKLPGRKISPISGDSITI